MPLRCAMLNHVASPRRRFRPAAPGRHSARLAHGLPTAAVARILQAMSETLLDVKGMNCPLPVLRANRSLRSMAPGERLRVLATDRAAIADFKAFCQETGHDLIAMSEEAGVLSFVIRRRADPPAKET